MATSNSVLIVDDETNLRRSLAVILQKAGYSAVTAGSADEALTTVENNTFDLVLLDIKMPGKSGLELLTIINASYPGTPVVLMTGHATLESAIQAIRGGAIDYILKPINPADLLSRLSEILTRQNQNSRRSEILAKMTNLMAEYRSLDEVEIEKPSAKENNTRVLRCGPFTVDLHNRIAKKDGKSLALSPTAFNYLVTLIRHSPHTVSYETLVRESQNYETTPIEAFEMARWRIHELRKTLEADSRHPQFIITIRNTGYRIVDNPVEET